jgi:aminoglycoside phosphotransferase (APT) family kinase protein
MMATDLLDQPQRVRSGEELDVPKLEAFLKARFPDLAGPLAVEQFPKGYSNLTYSVRFGDREMVLRRPPFGAKIKTAHDMGREYRILSHISPRYPKVPRPLVYCADESVLGAPFYLMERVSGIILRATPPPGLELSPPVMRSLAENFVENLVELHALDYAAAGLADLGKPEGYVTRQIEGWTKRYQNARTDDIPDMDRLARWLADHLPTESGACLIHNDYKYDNLVLAPASLSPPRGYLSSGVRPSSGAACSASSGLPNSGGASGVSDVAAPEDGRTPLNKYPRGEGSPQNPLHIKALLDWEMATIGDPLMDLGCTLGYWVDPDDPDDWQQQSFGVTTLPGNLNREQLLHRYSQLSARNASQPVFYYAYGLFKIAVIVQQIYARFKQGLTKDERFARLIHTVRAASHTAELSIKKNRISKLTL